MRNGDGRDRSAGLFSHIRQVLGSLVMRRLKQEGALELEGRFSELSQSELSGPKVVKEIGAPGARGDDLFVGFFRLGKLAAFVKGPRFLEIVSARRECAHEPDAKQKEDAPRDRPCASKFHRQRGGGARVRTR